MNCTCNRNHVDDDEHAPTCAFVLSAELTQLRTDNAELAKEVERLARLRAGERDNTEHGWLGYVHSFCSGALERAWRKE